MSQSLTFDLVSKQLCIGLIPDLQFNLNFQRQSAGNLILRDCLHESNERRINVKGTHSESANI